MRRLAVVAGDVHPEVAGDRQQRRLACRPVAAQDHDRVAAIAAHVALGADATEVGRVRIGCWLDCRSRRAGSSRPSALDGLSTAATSSTRGTVSITSFAARITPAAPATAKTTARSEARSTGADGESDPLATRHSVGSSTRGITVAPDRRRARHPSCGRRWTTSPVSMRCVIAQSSTTTSRPSRFHVDALDRSTAPSARSTRTRWPSVAEPSTVLRRRCRRGSRSYAREQRLEQIERVRRTAVTSGTDRAAPSGAQPTLSPMPTTT